LETKTIGKSIKPNSKSQKLKIENRKYGAFTLIELLVVIAVIVLLLAILLPTLRKAKDLAKRTTCSTNLKQLAVAWNLYLDDNDGCFYYGVNANINYGGWKGMQSEPPRPLNSYLNLAADLQTESEAKVFHCPSDRGGVPGRPLTEKAFSHFGTSYNTNIFLIGQDGCGVFSNKTKPLDEEIDKRLRGGVKRSRVGNPSRLLLIGDYGWVIQWWPERPIPPERKKQAEWHGKEDCYNLAFLDTHTQFLNIQKGYYVADQYAVLPFPELYPLALQVQGP
jgi:prepilin-type N-terminal cleavage/methylation domain-containing protein